MKKHISPLVMIIILLTGCTGEVVPVTPSAPVFVTASPRPSAVSTAKKTATLSPTWTYTPDLPAPTHTPTATLENQVVLSCPQVLDYYTENFHRQGVLVLGENRGEDYYFFDLETGNQRKVGKKKDVSGLKDYHVSPDYKWLATRPSNTADPDARLRVLDALGNQEKALPWDADWFTIVGWVDNEMLLISDYPGDDPHARLTLVNPFTGDRQEIRSDFPGIPVLYPYLDWEGYSFSQAVYHPKLSMVIFPRVQNEVEQLVLWDVALDSELHSWPVSVYITVTPQWSPDGTHFVANSRLISTAPTATMNKDSKEEELFLFGVDGSIERLTYLNQTYTDISFSHYSWSPDGRYLAFWFSLEDADFPDLFPDFDEFKIMYLGVLNMETREVTQTCLPGYFFLAPVWSPDSTQVAIATDLSRDQMAVIIYDLTKNTALLFEENMAPVGWMQVDE